MIAVLWTASLVGVAALVHAQAPTMMPLSPPIVLSGSDVGFRVEGRVGNRPAGVLVVRVNGEWVVPRISEGAAHLAAR